MKYLQYLLFLPYLMTLFIAFILFVIINLLIVPFAFGKKNIVKTLIKGFKDEWQKLFNF